MKMVFSIKRLNDAVGGAERVLCLICSGLVERGYDVTVITFDRPGGSPFYQLDERVKRVDLGIGDSAGRARVGETLHRMIALRRAIIREKAQVAVGFMHSMYVPLSLAMLGTGIPVIGSEHIVPEHYRSRPLQYLLLLATAPLTVNVTVLSEAIRLRYPGVMRNRMVVMPNPVSVADGHACPCAKKPSYTLLNVARFDPQKDHETLLRAFSLLMDSEPEWNLRLVGDGPLRGRIEQLIRETGMEGRVSMPGVISNIGGEYRSADAFVISSRYEAYGLVTAEAMSYGVPVVGFEDCPGTNELIEHEVTGILVKGSSDRAAALAGALQRLMDDPGLRCVLGGAARRKIQAIYSAESIYTLWENLLCNVVKKN